MLWTLMASTYKSGAPLPDAEIAHLMIGLLMAGQHSSAVTSSWIMLHLAAQPSIMEELYAEQARVLQADIAKPLTYEHLEKLTLVKYVIRETLRLHPPIHSIMRKVTSPLPVEGSKWVIPTSHVLLAAPGTMSMDPDHFSAPDQWDPHRWEENATVDAGEGGTEEGEKVDYGYGLVSTGASSPYLPFGAGRHRCIGEHYAYLQLTVLVVIMVREFKLSAVDGEARKGSSGVVTTDYSVIFCPPPSFFVSCLSSSFFSAFLSWFFSDLIIYSFNEAQLANGFPFRSVPTVPILATYGTGLHPVGKSDGAWVREAS